MDKESQNAWIDLRTLAPAVEENNMDKESQNAWIDLRTLAPAVKENNMDNDDRTTLDFRRESV